MEKEDIYLHSSSRHTEYDIINIHLYTIKYDHFYQAISGTFLLGQGKLSF